jgi:hypothetical protein
MDPGNPLAIQSVTCRSRPACWTNWLLVVAFLAVACDPGWHYQATSGTAIQAEGLRYDIPSANPKVRIYASAFTSSLDVELTLTNLESYPLELALPELQASDARGTLLGEHFPIRRSCPLTGDVMVIPGGGACTLASVFAIQPLVPGLLLPRENPDLGRISVKLTTAEPAPFPDIKVPLTWMK